MLELTGDDIAALNDDDLRTLIARLCEAELSKAGLPTSAVTAGGDQNAADGGLDVRVSLEISAPTLNFIPRAITGFQVKKPDMPRAEILREMRPDDVLRPILTELAEGNGAYVIISSQRSTSDSALRRRREAMREALKSATEQQLTTDFMDRGRVATWVREYPGLATWVRTKIGRLISGWQPHESWSTPQTVATDYLLDERVRIFDSRENREDGLAPLDGVQRMRSTLANPGSVARLIGLSGVGKTRLLEALFDPKVGEAALDPGLAVYCDISNEPNPSPRDMVRYLMQTRQRAIVVVDNCPPDTHRALATLCAAPGNTVSLITVEYDVRDDEPEATQVFRLEPASNDLIQELIERRAQHVSEVDRRRIAEFSEGNARVALALSNTVKRGETLGTLTDEDLFDRLFHQRDRADKSLLNAAGACSLVYSFDVETLEGEAAELPHLAQLAGQSVHELYQNVAELKKRDLVQQRSRWRAVLPHALANKMAKQALTTIHFNQIRKALVEDAPGRLLLSFSRRLGFLHDSDTAKEIVREWISDGGPLNDLAELSDLGLRMLSNVAPVLPDEVLALIEQSLADRTGIAEAKGFSRSRLIALARSLAYEAEHFPRSAKALAKFALAETADNRMDSARPSFEELFHIYLSGTKALLPARVQVAKDLISSAEENERDLGLLAFEGLLKAGHFTSSHDFGFGARPRDWGWQPQYNHEVREWYAATLATLSDFVDDPQVGDRIQEMVASAFKELWRISRAWDQLEAIAHRIAKRGEWSKGWLAVRGAMRLKEMPDKLMERLAALDALLKPKNLLQRAGVYLMSNAWSDLEEIEADENEADTPENAVSRYERANKRAAELAQQLASDDSLIDALLPDAVTRPAHRAFMFGKGLALGAPDPEAVWRKFSPALAAIDVKDRNDQVVSGFIAAMVERDQALVDKCLDEAVNDPVLASHYPRLQIFSELDDAGVVRLKRAIGMGKADAWIYANLQMGRVTDKLSSEVLCELVLAIAGLKDGYTVAVGILSMRLFSSETKGGPPFDETLAECGRLLMARCKFGELGAEVHQLGNLAKRCMSGEVAEDAAREFCQAFVVALDDYKSSAHSYDNVIAALFEVQPLVALDELVLAPEGRSEFALMRRFAYSRRDPVSHAPKNKIIEWAKLDAAERCPLLAGAVPLFKKQAEDDEDSPVLGWSEIALELLELAPDKTAFLDVVAARFMPNGWSGSLAAILDQRRRLPQALFDHRNPEARAWAQEHDKKLADWATRERQRERSEDERFE